MVTTHHAGGHDRDGRWQNGGIRTGSRQNVVRRRSRHEQRNAFDNWCGSIQTHSPVGDEHDGAVHVVKNGKCAMCSSNCYGSHHGRALTQSSNLWSTCSTPTSPGAFTITVTLPVDSKIDGTRFSTTNVDSTPSWPSVPRQSAMSSFASSDGGGVVVVMLRPWNA